MNCIPLGYMFPMLLHIFHINVHLFPIFFQPFPRFFPPFPIFFPCLVAQIRRLDVPGGRGRRHLVRHRGRRRKSADPGRAAVAVRAQRHGDAAQDSSIIFNVDDDIRDLFN